MTTSLERAPKRAVVALKLPAASYVSISGRKEAEEREGYRYTQMNTYLRRHPALSQTEREVLDVLVENATDYALLSQPVPVPVKRQVNPDFVAEALFCSRSTVERALANLEKFGIVTTKADPKDRRRTLYTLQPGPWPKLGDLPKRFLGWRDQPNAKRLVKEWRELVLSGAADDDPIGTLEAFLLDKGIFMVTSVPILEGISDTGGDMLPRPKKDRAQRAQERQARKESRTTEGHRISLTNEGHSGGSDPVDARGESTEERPPTREISPQPRAHANVSNKNLVTGTPQRAAAGASGHPSGGAGSQQAVSLADIKRAAEAWQPKRETNPVSAALSHYRKLVTDQFGVDLPASRKKDRAEMGRSVRTWGLETVLRTMDYVFDHWPFFQRELRLKGHSFPPRFLFTAQGWMEALAPQATKGEAPGGGGFDWYSFTARQDAERTDDLNAELEELL